MDEMIEQGYISVREHPDDPELKIYNYTDKAQYERVWNQYTLNARGLIMRGDKVVARGMPKFFNWQELDPQDFHLWESAVAYDKLDGSLGIIYEAPDGLPAVATRGSFTSEQALWATEFLRKNHPNYYITHGYTDLFEIIYPENRIVLDYGDREELVFLVTVDNLFGSVNPWLLPPDNFNRAEKVKVGTLADCLSVPPRENREGIVIYLASSGRMIKLKQEDYVRLHRIVTGLSSKTVWEDFWGDGNLREQLPEEFWGFYDERVEYLSMLRSEVVWSTVEAFHGSPQDRKAFAQYVMTEHKELAPMLFSLYDNNEGKFERALRKAVENDYFDRY